MAVFSASDVKSGTAADVNKIITYLETLPTQRTGVTASSTSSASSTLVTLVSSGAITVASDDLIVILCRVSFSSSDGASSTWRVELQDGSGALFSDEVDTSPVSNAGGDVAARSYHYSIVNASGSKTYTLKFSRNSGAGTIYSARSAIDVLVFKRKT